MQFLLITYYLLKLENFPRFESIEPIETTFDKNKLKKERKLVVSNPAKKRKSEGIASWNHVRVRAPRHGD